MKKKHGTLNAYRKCKCDICRAAKTAYVREYRKTHPRSDTKSGRLLRIKRAHAKLQGLPAPELDLVPRVNKGQIHGTRHSYQYYKCRCDLCKRAHADYQVKWMGS